MKITEILKIINELENHFTTMEFQIDRYVPKELGEEFADLYDEGLEKIREGVLSLPSEYPEIELEMEENAKLIELERRYL